MQAYPDFIKTLDKHESMLSDQALVRLHQLAAQAATQRGGVIVEIGAYRGASTVALATGVRTAGKGKVHSIDPHCKFQGVYGGVFSESDHAAYVRNIERHGLNDLVTHHCCRSAEAVEEWNSPIDLLFIDGDHSYDGVKLDIRKWVPFVADGGIVVLDDFLPESDVADAVRDHLPFARFLTKGIEGRALILQRTHKPRKMYLCGGMQSSGSSLVSWCFLQHPDLNGVDDMLNCVIQQDFSKVQTESVWVKMTIGSFRLREVADFYRAQGWLVQPMLIQRNIPDVIKSLQQKIYGLDGVTGDDPPLFVRVKRYLDDAEESIRSGWPVLIYENLLEDPESVIHQACLQIGLPWSEDIISWPKPATAIAYLNGGNETFRQTSAVRHNLASTVQAYTDKLGTPPSPAVLPASQHLLEQLSQVGLDLMPDYGRDAAQPTLSPAVLRGTVRDRRERHVRKLRNNAIKLASDIRRIQHHPVFGPLLRLWRLFINKTFPAS